MLAGLLEWDEDQPVNAITADILAIEAEAADLERKRIHDAVHVSRSPHPVFAHVDSYGLGQVIQGKPWPEDR